MGDALHACDRSGFERAAVHDGSVELCDAVGVDDRAAAGVKGGAVLEAAQCSFHGIK